MNDKEKILLGIFILLFVVSIVLFFDTDRSGNKSVPAINAISYNRSVSLFEDQLTAIAVQRLSGVQPIEGFDAELLLRAYPGLSEPDFDQVEALGGHYVFDGRHLLFEEDPNALVTSAARMITRRGYAKMLSYLSWRLNIPLGTENAVHQMIHSLGMYETKFSVAQSR